MILICLNISGGHLLIVSQSYKQVSLYILAFHKLSPLFHQFHRNSLMTSARGRSEEDFTDFRVMNSTKREQEGLHEWEVYLLSSFRIQYVILNNR